MLQVDLKVSALDGTTWCRANDPENDENPREVAGFRTKTSGEGGTLRNLSLNALSPEPQSASKLEKPR